MAKYAKSKNDVWVDSLKSTSIKNAIRRDRRKSCERLPSHVLTKVNYIYKEAA